MPTTNRCDINYNQLSTSHHSVNILGRISSFIHMHPQSKFFMKILAALFYGCSSFFIIVVNKVVLTTYHFPSSQVLGLGQMLTTVFVLQLGKILRIINFPNASVEIPKKVFPLPLFYIGNLICGLGGTQRLSLPMFTVLRRFAILFTMLGEYYILSVQPTMPIFCTVIAMVGGAMIAASNDLSYDGKGYLLVLSNDVFTAANGVYMKKKLDSKDLGKYGLMFYNSLFMLPAMMLICFLSGDIDRVLQFEYWLDFNFLLVFCGSCLMGFLLMFSTVLCTSYNSALTTTIVGCVKVSFIDISDA